MYKNLIFDADNTLWPCSEFYRSCQRNLAQYLSDRTGLNMEFIYKLQQKIDVEFTSLENGFDRNRFPRSFSATSAAIDIMMGNTVDKLSQMHCFNYGDEVFDAPYILYNGVSDMLKRLYASDYNIFICSKGDKSVQMKKMTDNNLLDLIPENQIYIVDKKTKESVQTIVDDHNLSIGHTAFIGDSLRDDIQSANQVGIASIWISGQSDTSWDYENIAAEPYHTIDTITDLLPFLDGSLV